MNKYDRNQYNLKDDASVREQDILVMAKAIRNKAAIDINGFQVRQSANWCYMLAEIAYDALAEYQRGEEDN